jgi:hypothetical protein
MRIALQSSIGLINAVQAYYRWHGANMMLGYVRGVLGDRRHRFLTCKEVSDNCGAEAEGINPWVEAMRRRYVAEARVGPPLWRWSVEIEKVRLRAYSLLRILTPYCGVRQAGGDTWQSGVWGLGCRERCAWRWGARRMFQAWPLRASRSQSPISMAIR